MTRDIDTIVARLAPSPVTEVSEGARDLMQEIMTAEPAPAPRRTRRRLSLRVAMPAGALLTAAVMAVTWLLPTSSAAALDIKQEGGYYVIEIKDLYANPKVYEQQLRNAGLDITLRVEPVTAALEGQVSPTAPDRQWVKSIMGIYPPGPCDKMDGCAIGMKIPVDFKGTADVRVGRKALPGEQFDSITSFDAKGEPMHCLPYKGKTVAEVRVMLEERGIRIEEFFFDDEEDPNTGDSRVATSVPDSSLVTGGYLTEPGVANVSVQSPEVPVDVPGKNNGCPSF
ncbi:hypothetical protein [Nonomuraea sp. NPDC049480]|uniref:hypothetical protein n=1 Tax=Nonomuraea sp. NPDC049480 TaxID=3364353 RepID=UPI00378F77C7